MKKMLKIMIYCLGIGLVVGAGIWAELMTGDYDLLRDKNGKVSIKEAIRINKAHN
jgi:hypothetical protein